MAFLRPFRESLGNSVHYGSFKAFLAITKGPQVEVRCGTSRFCAQSHGLLEGLIKMVVF